ncbi:nucleotidyltransferase domain-containing protein [Paenibacillus sp. 1P07SE]|uniref:nucleotidyltransferase domain-containing protein n=1 Tax=Paenibacillus sp. 1P07SE TaxID=3132209 RepID=UPI0039A63471
MDVQHTISKTTEVLKTVEGIQAIVLGGSRARGTARPESDIDIGIYYDAAQGLDLASLEGLAAALDDQGRAHLLTPLGGWGPWINGGGWLTTDGFPVDWLYRDLQRVSRVIDQSLRGEVTIDYQPGHPHGFINAIYAAEIAWCRILWDPTGRIEQLKSTLFPYPRALQKAMIEKFHWEADFALMNAEKGIAAHDSSYVAGCCFRAVACLNQVLFALNGTYWMNEKGAVAIAAAFSLAPSQYVRRVNKIISSVSADQNALRDACRQLGELIRDTEKLVQAESCDDRGSV